jgi:hypothetical protein
VEVFHRVSEVLGFGMGLWIPVGITLPYIASAAIRRNIHRPSVHDSGESSVVSVAV